MKSLIGQKFGRLTIIGQYPERIEVNGRRRNFVVAECECGVVRDFRTDGLVGGTTLSCGCLRKERAFEATFKKEYSDDLIGKKINRLTIIEQFFGTNGKSKTNYHYVKALCDCGKIVTYRRKDVLSGKSKSCRCFTNERILEESKKVSERKSEQRIGKNFGDLTIISQKSCNDYDDSVDNLNNSICTCSCVCGNIVDIPYSKLRQHPKNLSCGCQPKKRWTLESRQKLSKIAYDRVKNGTNPFYVDGKGKEKLTERQNAMQTPEYKFWRTQVFTRDSYTCVECGNIGGKLNAHHIQGWNGFPDLRLDVSNGVTMCESCHRKTPNYGGRARSKKNKNGDIQS